MVAARSCAAARGPRSSCSCSITARLVNASETPGHDDGLNLVLHLGGRAALVDPGDAAAADSPEWRHYFRGTSAHNTVTIGGSHQRALNGTLMGGRKQWPVVVNGSPSRHSISSRLQEDGLASEAGARRLLGRPLHRRSIFHRRGGATFVTDRVLGDGTYEAELTWHLPSGSSLQGTGVDAWIARGDGFGLQIALLTDATAEAAVVEGQDARG